MKEKKKFCEFYAHGIVWIKVNDKTKYRRCFKRKNKNIQMKWDIILIEQNKT